MSVAGNVLDRDFIAGCTDEKWIIDYIHSHRRRISIHGGCSRPILKKRIVGYFKETEVDPGAGR